MRIGLTRSFHAGRASLAFRRAKAGGGDGGASTPRKNSGEFRWYEEAAPYSNFQAKAPEVTADKVSVAVATPDLLNSAQPGQLMSWPAEIQAQLHHLGSYKPSQQNELFRQPVSVIREQTPRIWSQLLGDGTAKRSAVITGDSGVGKTSLLAQAHAAAKIRGWGVVHISRADKLLDGSTDAVYNPETKLWEQRMFMSRLWKKTVKANRAFLAGAPSTTPGTTLTQLVEMLSKQGKVLVTIDNVNALNHHVFAVNTNEKNEPLYHNDLEVVNTVLNWLKTPLQNTAVLAATSGNFKPIDWKGYAYAPLTDFDPQLVAAFAKAEVLELGHFSGVETRAYVEYLQAAEVTNKSWQELYQAGNGNPRTILATATNFAY